MPTLTKPLARPLVSIGIPTYNRPQQLQRALISIIAQTYPHFEVIVSDNCSPGSDTHDVVENFMKQDSRIRYVQQPANIGMFKNFKVVFELAKGEYFAWLADDDTREHTFLEKCLDIFEQSHQSPDLLLVNAYSQLMTLAATNTGTIGLTTDQGCTTLGLSPAERYYKYLSSVYTTQSAIGDLIHGVMKRKAVQKTLTIQQNILGWDRVFLSALALEGEFYTIPEVLMYSSPDGMSSMKNAKKMAIIQGIRNPFYIWKAKWVRMFLLQQLAWCSHKLSLIAKLKLSLWLWVDMVVRTLSKSS